MALSPRRSPTISQILGTAGSLSVAGTSAVGRDRGRFRLRRLIAKGWRQPLRNQGLQFGGLLGLQGLIDPTAEGAPVKNINALQGRALAQYGDLEAVPYGQLVDAMTGYRLKRRGAK